MSGLPKALCRARIIAAAFAVGSIVYLAMILGPLARLEQIAGAKPFDLRPGGYSRDSALAFISALGQDGRDIYLWRQIPLDTVYPALFAMSVAGSLCWLSERLGKPFNRWLRAAAFTAVFAALADYLENAMIVMMLISDAGPSPAVTHLASAATISKSVLTTLAMAALLLAATLLLALKLRRSGKPD